MEHYVELDVAQKKPTVCVQRAYSSTGRRRVPL